MDKNGILCPSKNVTLANEHVSYLENGLVLMAQICTIYFPSANMFTLDTIMVSSIAAKENYKEKRVFHILL